MKKADIDLTGQRCPVSTMRLKKHLKTLAEGTTFKVTTDDTKWETDLKAMLKKAGATLLSVSAGPPLVYEIKK